MHGPDENRFLAATLIIRCNPHSVMLKKFLLLFVILLFLFSSGCTQNSPTQAPQFTNPVEENISKILVTSTSVEEVWNALDTAKIPEKIGYRPSSSTNKVWIMAEFDPINNTWIAIDVYQKEIIHEGGNNSYFSGIFFDNYEDYQKDLLEEAWTPSTFSPILTTATTPPISPTPTPNTTSNIPDIDVGSIFVEAFVSFIIGAILIFFIGFDALDVFSYIFFIICLMAAVIALISHPSSDITTMTSKLSSFVVTWISQIAIMSLSGAFGVVFGSVVKMGTDILQMGRGGRGGGRKSRGRR